MNPHTQTHTHILGAKRFLFWCCCWFSKKWVGTKEAKGTLRIFIVIFRQKRHERFSNKKKPVYGSLSFIGDKHSISLKINKLPASGIRWEWEYHLIFLGSLTLHSPVLSLSFFLLRHYWSWIALQFNNKQNETNFYFYFYFTNNKCQLKIQKIELSLKSKDGIK